MSYDNLRECEHCGNYTTGRLCPSCARQEAIDNDPNPPPIPKLWCELCGVPLNGTPSGKHVVDVCQECFEDIKHSSDGRDNWDEAVFVHPYIRF